MKIFQFLAPPWRFLHTISVVFFHVSLIFLYDIMSRTSFRVNLHYKSCLNVKELCAWSRCHIWTLSDINGIGTHNQLVRKRTLNHLAKLAKWLSCVVSTIYMVHLTVCTFDCRCIWLNIYQVTYEFHMIITYSQMHRTDKCSQHNSIIWPVWLNGWVSVYELSGCGF